MVQSAINRVYSASSPDRFADWTMIIKNTSRACPSGACNYNKHTIIVRCNDTQAIDDIRYVVAHEMGHVLFPHRGEWIATKFACNDCALPPQTKYPHTSPWRKGNG